jgi:hypothetical protein
VSVPSGGAATGGGGEAVTCIEGTLLVSE